MLHYTFKAGSLIWLPAFFIAFEVKPLLCFISGGDGAMAVKITALSVGETASNGEGLLNTEGMKFSHRFFLCIISTSMRCGNCDL